METKRIRHWFPKLNQNDPHHLPNKKVQICDNISSTNTIIIEPLTCARKSLVTVSKLVDHQTDLNSVITEGEIPGDIKNSNIAKPQFVEHSQEKDMLNYRAKRTNNMLPASSKPAVY